MTLVELTMILGIGLSIVTASLIQGGAQLASIRAFKTVEYYSKEVPRMTTALQSLSRGSDTFLILETPKNNPNDTSLTAPQTKTKIPKDEGNTLFIDGSERDTVGAGNLDEKRKRSVVWLVGSGGKLQGGMWTDAYGAKTLPLNKYHLAVASAVASGKNVEPVPVEGWVLCKDIADVKFNIIPGTDGMVLVRVYKQYSSSEKEKLAFDLVLERK